MKRLLMTKKELKKEAFSILECMLDSDDSMEKQLALGIDYLTTTMTVTRFGAEIQIYEDDEMHDIVFDFLVDEERRK